MPAESIAARHLHLAFATPIAAFLWPESAGLNAELAALLLAREASEPSFDIANCGGWHSTGDLLTRDDPPIATLRARILRMARDMTAATILGTERLQASFVTTAWATVLRDGASHRVHDHPGAHWSGVYYVSPGAPDPAFPHNGDMEIIDPRTGTGMLRLPQGTFERRQVFTPAAGLMVMFPGWVKHYVHPYRGAGPRITIAFNIEIRARPG